MATPNIKNMAKKDNNPATKQDIKDLAKATKQDFNALTQAAKKEIQDFKEATKQDSNALAKATKQDLKDLKTEIFDKMVTKDVFHMHIRFIYEKLDKIESKMLTKEEHQKSMNLLDAFATELEAAREERILWEQQHLRHDDSIADHEKRIRVLEEKRVCS